MLALKHYLASTAILLILAAPSATAGDISISAEISQASIAFEAKDTLIVRLVWEGEPFLYQIDDFPMPSLEKMEILGSSSSVSSTIDSTLPAGEITIRTLKYILQPTDFGTGVVGALNLTAKNRTTEQMHDLKTGRLTVEIAKPVPRAKPDAGHATLYIVLAALIVIIGGGAIYIVLAKKRRAAEAVPVDMSYLEALKEIKKESVADKKLFFSRLYRLLLNYIEKERGLEVSGKTGEEVLEILGTLEDDAEKANLILWINQSQKVKYRPEAPSAGELDSSYNAVYQFFENKLPKG